MRPKETIRYSPLRPARTARALLHLPDCAWCPSAEDIQALPARLADGNGRQTGDPSSEQDTGSVPYGAIDPAIDGARAKPSLATSCHLLPARASYSEQGNTTRKRRPRKQPPRPRLAVQQSKPLQAQTCLERKPAIRPSPKRSYETQPTPAPVCEINVSPLKPWHSIGRIYHGPDQSSHPLKAIFSIACFALIHLLSDRNHFEFFVLQAQAALFLIRTSTSLPSSAQPQHKSRS